MIFPYSEGRQYIHPKFADFIVSCCEFAAGRAGSTIDERDLSEKLRARFYDKNIASYKGQKRGEDEDDPKDKGKGKGKKSAKGGDKSPPTGGAKA